MANKRISCKLSGARKDRTRISSTRATSGKCQEHDTSSGEGNFMVKFLRKCSHISMTIFYSEQKHVVAMLFMQIPTYFILNVVDVCRGIKFQ